MKTLAQGLLELMLVAAPQPAPMLMVAVIIPTMVPDTIPADFRTHGVTNAGGTLGLYGGLAPTELRHGRIRGFLVGKIVAVEKEVVDKLSLGAVPATVKMLGEQAVAAAEELVGQVAVTEV